MEFNIVFGNTWTKILTEVTPLTSITYMYFLNVFAPNLLLNIDIFREIIHLILYKVVILFEASFITIRKILCSVTSPFIPYVIFTKETQHPTLYFLPLD